jgi:hypothetical protein
MARYRLLITLAIVSLAFASYGDQPVFAPRDPSAARKDFSNVDPSTAIDALNLGTMATEAKTDYIATDTFTGHTADNSDVHGCSAVASASAVADALSAANASDALLLRLDGSRAMTGNIKFAGAYGIYANTSDGADNTYITVAGGGTGSTDRGAVIHMAGNELSTVGGTIRYYGGNVSSGDHIFYTGSGIERMRITSGGRVGIGVTDPYSALEVSPAISLRNTDNKTMRALHGSRFGYSGSYKAIVLGDPANNETVCIGYDPINNTTSQFSGNGYELLMRNGMVIKTPNSADNALLTYMKLVDGNVLIGTTTDDGTNKLQVNGSVAISSFMQLASPTAIPTAAAGRIYFNGTESKFKKCTDGSNWVDM